MTALVIALAVLVGLSLGLLGGGGSILTVPLLVYVADAGPREAITTSLLVVGVTSHRDLDPSQLPALREQVRAALAGLCEQFPSLSLVLKSGAVGKAGVGPTGKWRSTSYQAPPTLKPT